MDYFESGTKVRYIGPPRRAIEIGATYPVRTGQALYIADRQTPIYDGDRLVDPGAYIVYTDFNGIMFDGDRLRVPIDQVEAW